MDFHHQSCVFSIPRHRVGAGYVAFPALITAMLFLLPKFKLQSSRFVRAQYRLFEIWSPNSQQRPYYPGVRHPDHAVGLLDEVDYIRCDGHLGRFDPTSCPQFFSPEKPWLGFIKGFTEPSLVEFSKTPMEWEPSGPTSLKGYMRTDYLHRLHERQQEITETMNSLARIQQVHLSLWEQRPVRDDDVLDDLTTLLTYGQAVDRMAKAHRSLKHQDAWNRMAKALLRDFDCPIDPSDVQVLRADESLMGVWLNGTTELDGLRLLHHKVPCFVLSEVSSAEDHRRARGCPVLENFVARTSVESMSSDLNVYHIAPAKARYKLLDSAVDVGIATAVPEYPPYAYLRASPTVQGARVQFASVLNEPVLSNNNELIPPTIVTPGAGNWTHWIESTLKDNHTPCFEQIGSRRIRSVGGTGYFDRTNRRFLHFNEEPALPSNYKANPEVWGQPVGVRHFIRLDGCEIPDLSDLSVWMYCTERPERTDEGRVYTRRRSPGRLAEGSDGRRRSRSPFQHPSRYSRRARCNFYRPAEDIFRSPPRREYGDALRQGSESRNTRSRSRGRSRERMIRNDRPRRSEERKCPSDRPTLEQLLARLPSSRSRSPRPRRSDSLSSYRTSRHSTPQGVESPSPSRSVPQSSPSMVVANLDEQDEVMLEDAPPAPASLPSPVVMRDVSPPAPSVPPSPPALTSTLPAAFAFPAQDPETMASLVEMFPAATVAPVPVAENVEARALSKYLILWNLPAYYIWQHVVNWVCSILPLIGDPPLACIVRTNESGFQVFWMKFRTEEGAQRFRGVAHGVRLGPDETRASCDFVKLDEYNGANGRSFDRWSPEGLSYDRSLLEDYSDRYCRPTQAQPSLLSRLTMAEENPPEIPLI